MNEFMTSGIDVENAMHRAAEHRIKSKVVASASGAVAKVLNSITGSVDCKIVSSDVSGLTPSPNMRVYSGILRITASVTDKGDRKEINIPVTVTNSVIGKVDQYIVKKKLSSIAPKSDRHMVSDERMSAQIAEQQRKEAEYAKEEEALIKESKILSKEAKEVQVPTQAGGITTPDGKMTKVMTVEKVNYPQDIEAGDILSIGGKRWSVSDATSSFGQEESSKWVITLIED